MLPLVSNGGATYRPLAWAAALAGAMVATTLALWGYYGTAVFFEAVRAGWAACF